MHQSGQAPLALAECRFLTEGKKTSSKINLFGECFGAKESWWPLQRGVLETASTPWSWEPGNWGARSGGLASYLYGREPNCSFGVSELPVVGLGFGS